MADEFVLRVVGLYREVLNAILLRTNSPNLPVSKTNGCCRLFASRHFEAGAVRLFLTRDASGAGLQIETAPFRERQRTQLSNELVAVAHETI